tara:strand:+ start:111 stop:851 length:741 start_codon:yes stop_codon:yes gene_type:complete
MSFYTGWNLFKNQWQATVGSSRLGLLWKILPSLFWCVIFLFIRRGGEAESAAVGLAIGMVIYQTITDSFRSGSAFYQRNLALFIQNPNIIHATIIQVTIYSIVNCLFKIPIIYGLLIFFTDIPFTLHWLLLIPAAPLMVLLSLALGFVFSFTSYLNRDIAQSSYLIPLFILVFTPIIFVPKSGFVSIIQQINPYSHWLNLFKGMLLNSTINVNISLLLTLGSLFIFILSWKFVCYNLPYVAEESRS